MNTALLKAIAASIAVSEEGKPKEPIIYWKGGKQSKKIRDKSQKKHRARSGRPPWYLSGMYRTKRR